MRPETLRSLGDRLGSLSAALGTAGFERELGDFLGSLLPHDMMSVARYSMHVPPLIVAYSASFPAAMVESYYAVYRDLDPYVAYWRTTRNPDVVILSEITRGTRKVDRYAREFLFENGVRDEIALFLPPLAGSSLGFFYESATRRYGASHKKLLRSLHPLLSNLYAAHLRVLFTTLPRDMEASPAARDPVLVSGPAGETIWHSHAWAGLPAAVIEEQRRAAAAADGVIRASDTHRLAAETVADEPRRIVWVATANAGGHGERPDIAAWAQTRGLTPRECDIVELILTGYPTSLIAERLGLSRGTVKNHRRRIYDKLDITTERELFLMYIDAAIGPDPG
jgi:DNA-binding CsgD family transcriptional regulator